MPNYIKVTMDINSSIRQDMERWNTYPLGLSDRINVIKMNILPRLLYLFLSLPISIPQTQFSEWDKYISRFVWEGKRPRVRYTTLQLTKEKGGMSLPNLKEYFRAAQIRQITYWCSDDYGARWKDVELSTLNVPIQTNMGIKKIPEYITKDQDRNLIIS